MRKPFQAHLIALLFVHPIATAGSEHPSCHMPFAPLPSSETVSLREIAASCTDKPTSALFYNRAYHSDILGNMRRLSGLEKLGGDEDDVRYQQGLMYISLAEELARIAWRRGDAGAIRDLNVAYDRSIETLEYTIKGYNLLIGKSGAD